MPNLFNYLDYREYLEDFYKEEKSINNSFSYRYIAQKAGFKSKSFFAHVIEGKRNLSKDSIFMLRPVLKLNSRAFSYFCDLVAFNQATSSNERSFCFQKLLQYKKQSSGTVVLRQQYDFYSKWYNNTIRELVTIVDFKEDYALLASMIKPAITARQARASVQLLLKLGLLSKTSQGYTQTDKAVTTGDEVQSLAVQNFHMQNMILAAESIDSVPSSRRDISCIVAGLSAKGVETVKDEIQQFRKRLVEIITNDEPAQEVCHINFQLFPTSAVQAIREKEQNR